ncbi:ferredoxin [Candidatus Parcubacteria bacterium]|nr:MAG: ferredoxin [Candidatus Parcubacteria bacterium]
MKPKVNPETCIGCGTCESLCPNVFKVEDDGKAHVLDANYDEYKECIDQSIEACATQAITKE